MTIVQEGLGAIRVVKAFAQGAFERQRLECEEPAKASGGAHARRVRSLLGPVVTVLVAVGTAAVLWFGARLVLAGAMTAGALVVFMTYLGRLFRPIQDLARASTNIAQAAVGLERVMAVLDADERLPRVGDAADARARRRPRRVSRRDVRLRPGAARCCRTSRSRRARPADRPGRAERQRQVHARRA